MKRIPFLSPTFPEPEDMASIYASIMKRGVFTNRGPAELEFADSLARWVGHSTAASVVSSCTAGLDLAMRVLFPADRDIVLVASFTFAAGPLAVLRCGFEPRFVDVDPTTWQPRVDHARELIEEGGAGPVAGILLTTTFGVANSAIDAWEKMAQRHNLPLVIDSAAGFGSTYASGDPLGARGDCEVFSFHATKTLAVGEGGAITSRFPEVIRAIDQLKNFGFNQYREAVSVGTNAKLTELSSAIGVRQLDALQRRLRLRQNVLDKYQVQLRPLGLEFQPNAEHSALAFVSVLTQSNDDRNACVAALDEAGIECRTYYGPPVHCHAVFSRWAGLASLPVTEDISARVLSLPMSDELGDPEIERIASAIAKVLRV